MRSFAADDAQTIQLRLKELAAERERARCSCPHSEAGYREGTDTRCEVHGTPAVPLI